MKTIEQANAYLDNDYLVWWERELKVESANPDNAHRPLHRSHDLAASLSYWRPDGSIGPTPSNEMGRGSDWKHWNKDFDL